MSPTNQKAMDMRRESGAEKPYRQEQYVSKKTKSVQQKKSIGQTIIKKSKNAIHSSDPEMSKKFLDLS